jgi:hypothetical protein
VHSGKKPEIRIAENGSLSGKTLASYSKLNLNHCIPVRSDYAKFDSQGGFSSPVMLGYNIASLMEWYYGITES